jgi:glycosyltransferase involved in cell wall biosynthesis
MKIAFDNQIFLSQKHGGISRYFCNLIKYLDKDPAVKISLPIEHHENDHLREIENISGIIKSPKRKFDFLKGKKSNSAALENFLVSGNFDLLHATYYDDNLLKLIEEKPFVITIHDMIYEIFPEFFSPKDRLAQLKKYLITKADKIITVSEHTKKDLLLLTNVREEKVAVVPLASSLEIKNSNIRNLNLPQKYLLYVGNRAIYKNFYFMINSIYELLLEDSELELVCFGSEFSKKEQIFFQNLGIAKKIRTFRGYDSELSQLYQNAQAFIFPSYYEGFGIPSLEAFSCGCPLIASNATSIPEVAGDAAIYFDPKSKIEIKNAVKKVLQDSNFRENLIKKGFERNKLFSWEKSAQATKEVYNSIL